MWPPSIAAGRRRRARRGRAARRLQWVGGRQSGRRAVPYAHRPCGRAFPPKCPRPPRGRGLRPHAVWIYTTSRPAGRTDGAVAAIAPSNHGAIARSRQGKASGQSRQGAQGPPSGCRQECGPNACMHACMHGLLCPRVAPVLLCDYCEPNAPLAGALRPRTSSVFGLPPASLPPSPPHAAPPIAFLPPPPCRPPLMHELGRPRHPGASDLLSSPLSAGPVTAVQLPLPAPAVPFTGGLP